MSPAPEIKGWCPGAYAPMASNDGLLIRAKVVGARATASQLAAIAAISQDCGNGLVDLSQRAQLQLRGVRCETLDDALRRLDAQGLLAASADAERVVNIVASPLAGLDESAGFDANALAAELAQALQADAMLTALPAKFLFAVDDGGALSLEDVEADIRLEACESGGVAIRVAGARDEAILVDMRDATATAVELARSFVTLRNGSFELRRMSRLVAAIGGAALLREAGVAVQPYATRRIPRNRAGLGAQQTGNVSYAGVAAPFGRWRAQELAVSAQLAESNGLGEIRLTPWRALLIPAQSHEAAEGVARALDDHGLITGEDDPRLAVVACPGAPECPQARGETRAHLARLAPLAQKLAGRDGVGLHVSGCAKGCARPGATATTLIAHDGAFDLVYDGRAGDAPQATGLTIDAVERALMARAEEHICPTP
jgi:precorrin-3B synthase